MQAAKRILKPETIRRECEDSLRRLGVERIDLYQFHWPDETGTPVEDSWGAMVKLIEEGKIRAAGVSNFNVDLLERCEAIRHVDSLQPIFSLISRKAARQIASLVQEPRYRRDLLQPDAVRNFDGRIYHRARRENGERRLAAPRPRVSGTRRSAAISRCAMRCGPSPRATEPPSRRSRLPGRSRGRA